MPTKQLPPHLRSPREGHPKKHHGGYAFLTSGTMPADRRYILGYLTSVRERIVRDLGPLEEDLTAAQVILIDRLVVHLGVVRLMEEAAKEKPLLTPGGHMVAPLGSDQYRAFNTAIQRTLAMLGLERRAVESILTPFEVARKIDREKAKEPDKADTPSEGEHE